VYLTVVINEAQLTKLIHEETDERTRGADHLRERFLADLCNDLSLAITSGNVWANSLITNAEHPALVIEPIDGLPIRSKDPVADATAFAVLGCR
jgi:hypothetical protein